MKTLRRGEPELSLAAEFDREDVEADNYYDEDCDPAMLTGESQVVDD